MVKYVVVVLLGCCFIKPLFGVFQMAKIIGEFPARCIDLSRIGFHHIAFVGYFNNTANPNLNFLQFRRSKGDLISAYK